MEKVKEVLIECDGYIEFLIEFDDSYIETMSIFRVYEVSGWKTDESHTPIEEHIELYVQGSIKWDGCSTVNFQEGLHLCGKAYWESHNEVMSKIWEVCTKRIKNFNEEEAN